MKKEAFLYKLVRPILKVLFPLIYNPKITGKENIPKSGRIIIAANHTDDYDCILFMLSTKRCIHFLAKKELFEGKAGFFFRNMGLIPVDRSRKDHEALVSAIEYLNDDKVVGIFPEGRVLKTKKANLPFKMGVIKMAHETNSKIIPCRISGDFKFRSKNLKMEILEPFELLSDDFEKEKERLEKIISNER